MIEIKTKVVARHIHTDKVVVVIAIGFFVFVQSVYHIQTEDAAKLVILDSELPFSIDRSIEHITSESVVQNFQVVDGAGVDADAVFLERVAKDGIVRAVLLDRRILFIRESIYTMMIFFKGACGHFWRRIP